MIWVNFITTELWSPEPWNHGFMAELFRLVNYYNLVGGLEHVVFPFHIWDNPSH